MLVRRSSITQLHKVGTMSLEIVPCGSETDDDKSKYQHEQEKEGARLVEKMGWQNHEQKHGW